MTIGLSALIQNLCPHMFAVLAALRCCTSMTASTDADSQSSGFGTSEPTAGPISARTVFAATIPVLIPSVYSN